jgi:hypothetical protein
MHQEKNCLGDRNKRNKASSSHPTLDSSTMVFGDLFWQYGCLAPALRSKDTQQHAGDCLLLLTKAKSF